MGCPREEHGIDWEAPKSLVWKAGSTGLDDWFNHFWPYHKNVYLDVFRDCLDDFFGGSEANLSLHVPKEGFVGGVEHIASTEREASGKVLAKQSLLNFLSFLWHVCLGLFGLIM